MPGWNNIHCELWTALPTALDISIPEAVWDHLDKKQNKQAANIQSRAVNFIQKAQSTVLDDALKKLQESLPERVPVVLKYKGGHTRY